MTKRNDNLSLIHKGRTLIVGADIAKDIHPEKSEQKESSWLWSHRVIAWKALAAHLGALAVTVVLVNPFHAPPGTDPATYLWGVGKKGRSPIAGISLGSCG